MTNAIFNSNVVSQTNNIRAAYAAGYNVAFKVEDLGDLHREVADAMRNELTKTQNINIATTNGLNILRTAYATVAVKHATDPEIYAKLQYIYDTRIDAYAGYNTNQNGISTAVSAKSYPHASDKTADYEYQQYVNLGIVKRDKTDLTLLKDVAETRISTPSLDVVYTFNRGSSTNKQFVYEEDYRPNTTANSTGTAWYSNMLRDMQFYVKYKITIQNTTNTATQLTEIVDYFDGKLGYSDSYTTLANNTLVGIEARKIAQNGTQTNINNVKVNTTSKYPASSQIGIAKLPTELTGADNYSQLYILFENEPSIVDKEKVEVYLTFKLGKANNYKIASKSDKTAKQLFNEFVTASGTLSGYNYAEVNGYKTNGGFLDADSKPGSFRVKDFEAARTEYQAAYATRATDVTRYVNALNNLNKVREDDAWCVEVQVAQNANHRELSGNVWEAVSNEVKTSGDLQSHDMLKYDSSKNIEGIIVELVELDEANHKQIVRGRTVTASNGSYKFDKVANGSYAIRFIYGAEARDGYNATQLTAIKNASKKYNGLTHQSTKANLRTNETGYWVEIDRGNRVSDAYDDAYSRAITSV